MGRRRRRRYHFEVLDNRQLTPQAMLVSVYQTLQGTNMSAAEMSYREGEMRLAGADGEGAGSRCGWTEMMAQNEFNPGAINAALFVGERFSRVYENALEQPVVTGLKLKVEAIPERRTAVIETARLSRMEASGRDGRGRGDAAAVPGRGAGGADAGAVAGGYCGRGRCGWW